MNQKFANLRAESLVFLYLPIIISRKISRPPSLFSSRIPHWRWPESVYFITNWMIVNQVGQIVCGPLVLFMAQSCDPSLYI